VLVVSPVSRQRTIPQEALVHISRKPVPKLAQLSDVALFRTCSAAELRRIAALTTAVERPAGVILCTEGSVGREAFVIREGEATVEIDGRTVATLGPGDIVGELALLDRGPRTATVRATTAIEVLVLSKAEFATLVTDAPGATQRLLESLSRRLRAADKAAAAVGVR
jgi:CRP-like cAMP-binding protein